MKITKKRGFHIDERYVTVNLTLSIIIYSFVVPFCIYLSVDNFLRGNTLVASYALFCAIMTAIAIMNFSICKFGKKKRKWLMHLALNIQCVVYWITFTFFLYTGGTEGTSIFLFFVGVPVVFFFFNLSYGLYFNLVFFIIMCVYMYSPLKELGYQFPASYYSRLQMMFLATIIMVARALAQELEAAAKEGKADFVLSKHDVFLKEYDIVLDAIKKAVNDEEDTAEEFEIDENGFMEFLPENG